jgi:hypothetical protein
VLNEHILCFNVTGPSSKGEKTQTDIFNCNTNFYVSFVCFQVCLVLQRGVVLCDRTCKIDVTVVLLKVRPSGV